jgi:hypothetical protein
MKTSNSMVDSALSQAYDRQNHPMQPNGARIPYSTYGHPSFYAPSHPIQDGYSNFAQHPLPAWPPTGYEAPPSIPQQMWGAPISQPLQPMTVTTLPMAYDIPVSMASPISQADSERSYGLVSTTSLSTEAPSPEQSPREPYRAGSPGHADLNLYGFMNPEGTWSCAYPGCTSRAVFTRGCDLRKHHKRHTKSFFCRYPGCTQASGGGFSSKKDLARHEAKHNPGVVCEWTGCDRIFSRVDNMVSATT